MLYRVFYQLAGQIARAVTIFRIDEVSDYVCVMNYFFFKNNVGAPFLFFKLFFDFNNRWWYLIIRAVQIIILALPLQIGRMRMKVAQLSL